jgi:NAD(P)-dependent dehydrogenase (short-subunit alcohol dehydrogenase family)
MKVLVTGATGYLGAVAAEALVTRGHQVWDWPDPSGPLMHCASAASRPLWATSATR